MADNNDIIGEVSQAALDKVYIKYPEQKIVLAHFTPKLNLRDGEGKGSIVQLNGGVVKGDGKELAPDSTASGVSAITFGARCSSIGDASITGGYNSKAYTKTDVAFNNSVAGLTAEEFNTLHPNGYSFNDDGLQVVDYTNQISGTGEGGFIKRVVNGAFACNAGRAKGLYTFSCGLQTASGAGSWAPYSATFGQACKTVYEEKAGVVTTNASCSFVGGISSAISAPHSIGYGRNLTIPKRTVNSFVFATATFGSFNNHNSGNDHGAILEIGNGTSDSAKSNAFEVTWNGRALAFRKDEVAYDSLEDADLLTKKEIEAKIQDDIKNKADKATTLSGYGITDAYTKEEADGKLDEHLEEANAYTNERFNGANKSISYNNYETMIGALNSKDKEELSVGQNIYIGTLNVPDVWVSEINNTQNNYTHTTDEDFENELNNEEGEGVQVGYYTLKPLEGQKAYLIAYQKHTPGGLNTTAKTIVGAINELYDSKVSDVQINGTPIVKNGVAHIPIATSSNLGLIKAGLNGGLFIETSGNMSLIKASENDILTRSTVPQIIAPSNLDYAVMASLTNPINHTWTSEEQAAARTTLDAEQKGKITIGENVYSVQTINKSEFSGSSDLLDNTITIILESE